MKGYSLEDDPQFKELKDQHKQFIRYLLEGRSAVDSYSLCYPKAGYNTAAAKGHELKHKPVVQELLRKNDYEGSHIIRDTANATVENLRAMAFADLGDIFKPDGTLKPIRSLPKALRISITEIEVEGDKVKWKLGGKTKALELLSKITKIAAEPTTQVEVNIISEEERDRAINEILIKANARDPDSSEE